MSTVHYRPSTVLFLLWSNYHPVGVTVYFHLNFSRNVLATSGGITWNAAAVCPTAITICPNLRSLPFSAEDEGIFLSFSTKRLASLSLATALTNSKRQMQRLRPCRTFNPIVCNTFVTS